MTTSTRSSAARPTPLTNWAGNVAFHAARLHRPATLAELRGVVAANTRVRALGSTHSFSPVADTDGQLVRLDRMPVDVDVDRAARTVTVSAGTTYAELARHLDRAGLALANLASLPHISVAGCCATGTHGSGRTLRCLAAAVRAVQLVGADGDLVELDRDADPDTFPGAVVSLGGLGVVTRLTLDVEPTYQVAQRVRVGVPLDEVEHDLDAVLDAAYSVSVFTDWRGPATVWLKRRTDAGPATGWSGGRPATVPVHPIPGQPADNCTVQFDRPGPWHERLTHFRPEYVPGSGHELQSEYFVPADRAGEAVAAVRGIAGLLAPVLQVSELRAVRGDDLWLSPAYRRDSLALHFTWRYDPAAVTPAIGAVEDALRPLAPRPHWGKLTTIPPAEVAARYPRSPDFRHLRRTLDPRHKFTNAYLRDHFPDDT